MEVSSDGGRSVSDDGRSVGGRSVSDDGWRLVVMVGGVLVMM